ncbi:Non-specific serine/threonine protein kinase [Sulfidibacter corallicola]|uniref:Protein kinase n=1 Tax=Sulfidibacter corallicola TaxID=2818388 RepID=A0A8A4TJJ9_SULCO|nr:protein kinase [Sulfidibacter corallicola]QTD50209.1 protein kinase [Sulfidibacter corallicola]
MNDAPQPLDLNRVQAIFEAALDHAESARPAYLDETCGGDARLREEVEALLAIQAQGDLFPDPPLLEPQDMVGREIGPYHLVRCLGHGGMGSVYLGRRIDDEVQMSVSIKLVQHLFTTPDMLRRFRRERQVLADLKHAYIAMLLDAGTTEEGFPYLIMEFIDGETIEKWHRARQPSLSHLLRLFHKLATAVGFAHASGVVHRDIKPGNLMVTRDGVPKLLDFGIATLRSLEHDAPAHQTGPGGPMTPMYASPEQLRGESVDETTDIYSLGLVLLHLLWGSPPNTWDEPPLETVTRLTIHGRNYPTRAPSDDERRSQEEAPRTEEPREPVPEALGHVLRMALAENPRSRYQTANEFLADLDRVLAGLADEEPDRVRSTPRHDAFLWHHPDDAQAVAHLARLLTDAGIDLHPGWEPTSPEKTSGDGIGDAAQTSATCLACLGPGHQAPWQSDPATSDMLAFRAGELRFLPLLMPGAAFPNRQSLLPTYLRGQTWTTFPNEIEPSQVAVLVETIRGLPTGADADMSHDGTCPFRGLEVFREEDRAFFVGREAASQRIVEYLAEHPFIGVLGPSGSGKSSVVQAGAMPPLRERGFAVSLFKPGSSPLEELAFALARLFEEAGLTRASTDLLARLHKDVAALHFIAEELVQARSGRPLCLVIDQFEEVFTLAEDPVACERFVANLCHALEQRQHFVSVVLTMRSDFLGMCPTFPALDTILLDHALQLGPMRRENLARAVAVPARLVGLTLEPGLLVRILDDVTGASGTLPLLEHALLELYERRKGNLLTLEAYQAIGGIEGALAQRAETEFAALDERARNVLRKMFTHCLIYPGEGHEHTRRRATREELLSVSGSPDIVAALLARWTSARLLTGFHDQARGRELVDVAHEALIRKWPRIAEWMAADRETARLLGSLRLRAQSWDEAGRDEDHLLRGALLLQMRTTLANDEVHPGTLEQEFVICSIALETRLQKAEAAVKQRLLRRRNQAFATGAVALFLATVAFFMYFRADRAEATALLAKGEAVSQTRESNYLLAKMFEEKAGTELDENNPERAWLFSLAALSRDIPADRKLPGAIGRFADPRMADAENQLWSSPVAVPGSLATLAPDGSRLALACRDYTIRVVDTATGRSIAALSGHRDRIEGLAFRPDGGLLASASVDHHLRFWQKDGDHWRPRFEEQAKKNHGEPVHALAFSPDGQLLATATAGGSVYLWEVASGDRLARWPVAKAPLTSLAFAPDGRSLALAAEDATLATLDVRSGARHPLTNDLAIHQLHWIEDALWGIDTDGRILRWEYPHRSGAVPRHFPAEVHHGRTIAMDRLPGDDGLIFLDMNGRITIRDGQSGIVNESWQAFPEGSREARGSVSARGSALSIALAGQMPQIRSIRDKASIATLAGHTDIVWSVAFSPDDHSIASASNDKTIAIWDRWSGSQRAVLCGHEGRASDVAWSPDGQALASASFDGTIILWDALTGRVRRRLIGHRDAVYSVAFAPNGRLIASGSIDRSVKLWDTATGELVTTLSGHRDKVGQVLFSPDGRFLVSSSKDESFKIWNAATHREVATLKQTGVSSRSMTFAPNSHLLAWGTKTHHIKWCDLSTFLETGTGTDGPWPEQKRTRVPHAITISSLSFSADGTTIASATTDGTIGFWDLSSGRLVDTQRGHTADVTSVQFSGDGQHLASASYDRTVRLWRVDQRRKPAELAGHDATIYGVAFSPSGTELVSASHDRTIKVWDPAKGTLSYTLGGFDTNYHEAVYSPDGTMLASASRDGLIRLWDLANRKVAQTLEGHDSVVYSVAFSPDGRRLVSGSADTTVMLWDVATGRPLTTFRGHRELVRGVAFSPDGRTLASASFDQTVRLWDSETASEMATMTGHTSTAHTVAFSPDGRILASTSYDNTARLWDATSGKSLGILAGHRSSAEGVAFSKDGAYIVTSTANGIIHLWDAVSHHRLATIDNSGFLTYPIAFCPDAPLLASVGTNRRIRFWHLDRLGFFLDRKREPADYLRLFDRSLFHFGYRLEGSRLVNEPRFGFEQGANRANRDDHELVESSQPQARTEGLLHWLER